MGLFGKKKNNKEESEVKGGGMVEAVDKNSSELQDLLKEFREMRNSGDADYHPEEDESPIIEEVEDGEEYQVSESESESIEDFLSASDDSSEGIEEEVEEEEIEEEIIEDESGDDVEEEIVEESEDPDEYEEVEELAESEEIEEVEEPYVEEESQVYEDEEEIEEVPVEDDLEAEEEVLEEYEEEIEEPLEADEDDFAESTEDYEEEAEIEDAEEPIDVQVGISEAVEEYETPEEESVEEDTASVVPVDAVTTEEMEKKIDERFDEFEKRLLDKLMQQFALMQTAQPKQEQPQIVAENVQSKTEEEEELEIKTVNGKMAINGFVFSGEVVMFTPIESVKKASWEEVVRRKGHCTYHLTTSGNGGWFIKKSNAPNPYAYIEKKEEAEELAKIYAMREKAELKIHNAKGVIEKSLSFGREKLRG